MRLSPFLFALLILTACGDPPPGTSTGDPAADSAFALLTSFNHDAIAEAYARLGQTAHTAELELALLDSSGQVLARHLRVVERRPTADGVQETTVRIDTAASLPEQTNRLIVQNPLPHILPDDPAFLDPRARDQYAYTTRKETNRDGQQQRIVEARLHDDEGSEQAIAYARYRLADDDRTLLSIDVRRASASALFDETSRVQVRLGLAPDSTHVPRMAVAESMVDVPGSPPTRLRLTQRFRDVEVLED